MRRPDLDAWMARFTAPSRPGAAVAVQQGGALIHEGGYGLANLEWDIPIDVDTVFRLGSITKQFTAAAIMRLAEAGKLGVDDPLARWLPDAPTHWRGVTLRHLMNHTSGVANYTDDPRFMTEEVRRDHTLTALIDRFRDLPPDFPPGERYSYSNSGYVLLGAVIEAASGKDYESFLRTEIFEPLDLSRTSYLHNEPVVAKRASGYVGYRTPRNAPPISMFNPHAAGALGSTVGDLIRWERALRTGEVVSPEGYRAMSTPDPGSDGTHGYGLVRHTLRDETAIGHGGGINGFLTFLAHWPAHDLTIAILANSGAFPVQQAFYGLSRRMLGQPDAAYAPIELPETALAACAGAFHFPNTEVLDLRLSDGRLASSFPHPGSRWRPFGPDRFFLADDPEITLYFEDAARSRLRLEDYRQPMVGARQGLD